MKVYRGSRKHVLDWTSSTTFLEELASLASPAPVGVPDISRFMPRGYSFPQEARLETFGRLWKQDDATWDALQSWWLQHTAGANTPNWDIASGCLIENRPGLLLVEAKANWPELGVGGKWQGDAPSDRSEANHKRIEMAINEACVALRQIDPRVDIKHSSHYQLANRLAFTWKLATLGIPVVLMYLGFTGDEGIRDAGEPFVDDADWQRAFRQYACNTVPAELFERRLDIESTPVWLLSRSLRVIEQSPPKVTSASK